MLSQLGSHNENRQALVMDAYLKNLNILKGAVVDRMKNTSRWAKNNPKLAMISIAFLHLLESVASGGRGGGRVGGWEICSAIMERIANGRWYDEKVIQGERRSNNLRSIFQFPDSTPLFPIRNHYIPKTSTISIPFHQVSGLLTSVEGVEHDSDS